MANLTLTDTIAFESSAFDAAGKLKRTGDGYAVMECPVARSGIQEYLAAEMGDAFADRDPRSIIRVYRPDDVIFGKDSLNSYAHKPITNDHPPEQVTSENWKKYAKGHTGNEVRFDSGKVYVPMLMADGDTISDAESGKREWSAGYSVSFDILPDGVAPDGTLADAIVTGQKINHIALVDRGRAGPDCRIGDNSASDDALKENRPMAEVKMQDGGIPFTVADATAEAVVRKIIEARDKAATDLAAAQTQVATLTTDAATATAEIATLKQAVIDAKVTPAQMRDAAAAFAKVLADAKRIAPALTLADTLDEAAVKAAVVNAKLGDAAKGWTEAQFDTSFATMAASLSDADEDGIQKVVNDGGLSVKDAEKAVTDARDAYIKGLQDAHRPAAGNA